jgi:DnaK suppressor protein
MNPVMATAGAVGGKRPLSARKASFRTDFLVRLIDRKRELEEALERLINSQREYGDLITAEDFIEMGDNAGREILANTHYSLLERKVNELKKIEVLIRRTAEDHEFGLCEECGRRIPIGRLQIVPDATTCVPCQRELEKMSVRGRMRDTRSDASHDSEETSWEDGEDLTGEGLMILKPEAEYVSITELEETDVVGPRGSEKDR